MASYEKYWIDRADRRIADRQSYLNASIFQIQDAYDEAMKELNSEINHLFLRLMKETGLSRAEVKKLLEEKISSKELAEIRSKIDTITDEEILQELKQKLEVSYYKSRISRQEALREAIHIQMSAIADKELAASTKAYTDVIREEYYHNIFDSQQYLGFAFNFVDLPEKVIEQILADDWSGKHYSKRIWGNSQTMAGMIEKIILKGAMKGTNSRKMAQELNKISKAGMYACERLIRTETTYFTAMADLEAAKARGTEKVQFVATLDTKTSEQCRAADGKIIPVSEAKPGRNIPPLHPFCRSVIIDVIEGLVHKVRRARNPKTRENYKVPADMTYQKWKGLPIPILEKKLDLGSVKNVVFRHPIQKTTIPAKDIACIKRTIAEVGETYELKLDCLEIGEYTDEEHMYTPVFFRTTDEDDDVPFRRKLIINNSCPFWGDEKARKNIFSKPYFAAQSVEDIVRHELAHAITFQGCKSLEECMQLEEKLQPRYVQGISGYSDEMLDGAETIAEAFVKKNNGYAIPTRAEYLLEQFVEVWRK